MSNKLVQDTSKDNKAQMINYCLTNEPCNRRNMARHSNISLPIVTHDNNSMKKKCFLDLQTCTKIQIVNKNSRNIIYSKIQSNIKR